MTFKELCDKYSLTPEEKRMAAIFLITLRLAELWESFIGGDNG